MKARDILLILLPALIAVISLWPLVSSRPQRMGSVKAASLAPDNSQSVNTAMMAQATPIKVSSIKSDIKSPVIADEVVALLVAEKKTPVLDATVKPPALTRRLMPQSDLSSSAASSTPNPNNFVDSVLVGVNPYTGQYWVVDINAPKLTEDQKGKIIADLNQNGLSSPKTPKLPNHTQILILDLEMINLPPIPVEERF